MAFQDSASEVAAPPRHLGRTARDLARNKSTDRDKFLAAWNRFGTACGDTIAPEATYQAWLAHFLIEQFGLRKVVREVDFGARHLQESDRQAFHGSNLRLDVCVLHSDERVYLPHRSALGDPATPGGYAAHSGLGRLKDLAIISELKVGSSVTNGLPYSQINRDAQKLQAILAAGRNHALNAGRVMPLAFVCVVDNHPTWRLNRRILASYQERTDSATGVEWLILPTTQRHRGQGTK